MPQHTHAAFLTNSIPDFPLQSLGQLDPCNNLILIQAGERLKVVLHAETPNKGIPPPLRAFLTSPPKQKMWDERLLQCPSLCPLLCKARVVLSPGSGLFPSPGPGMLLQINLALMERDRFSPAISQAPGDSGGVEGGKE